ncbi:MAG: hypothetical protein ACFBSE_17270 [Prochloraceae cyanobacterium]
MKKAAEKAAAKAAENLDIDKKNRVKAQVKGERVLPITRVNILRMKKVIITKTAEYRAKNLSCW